MGNIFSVKDACATLLVLRFRRNSPSAFLYPYVYIYIYIYILYVHPLYTCNSTRVGYLENWRQRDTKRGQFVAQGYRINRVIFQPSFDIFISSSSPRSFLNFISLLPLARANLSNDP